MSQLCYCCSSCKPRYKRLVDSIYPRTPPFNAPLNGNMQKLTFYSISHPEKLNRIGIYLVQRLSRDLSRQRLADVKVTVDAMDQLLKSCHGSPSLNQFVESYLLMVQRLLETNDAQMEKLATDLFVRFSGIEEDSPSYHRQYDFFISKFSSMCHANHGNLIRSQRFNGIRGLRGVIWKSASDDLQANIWEKQHMNKIIPSILFVLQDDNEETEEQQIDHTTGTLFHHYSEEENAGEVEPKSLALQCLRELFQKCSFGSLKSVLEPVFKHFDLHKKWDPPSIFAIKIFKAILYSIQSQNSYFVIQELINQLEQVPNTESRVRVGLATVLSNIVGIAGTTIGPLLLAIFNSLLKLLRSSVEFQQSKQCINLEAESTFQDTLINALGDFASALPDYQKVEIMMFTAGSIPNILENAGNNIKLVQTSEEFLQKVLVKTLLEVATKYKTFYLAAVFTDAFLKTLMQLHLTRDAEVRFFAFQIFHTLLDRHDNLPNFEHLAYSPDLQTDLQLTIEKCSRQDQLFMRRHIHTIITTLYRNVNTINQCQSIPMNQQLDAVLCSMALLSVEVNNDETQVELLRLAFSLQQLALEGQMKAEKTAGIHNLVARYMNLNSQLLSIPALCQHVQQVIKTRTQRGHPLLNIMKQSNSGLHVVDISNTTQTKTVNQQQQSASGAYSPPVGKAPIAHMDSEDDVGLNTARKENAPSTMDQIDKLDLSAEPSMLFSQEIFYEGFKESNKEAQRLLQPFKPVMISQSMDIFVGTAQHIGQNANGLLAPSFLSVITAPDQSASSTTTTSGGLMFSSPFNSRRNVSAIEISGMVPVDESVGQQRSETNLMHSKHDAISSGNRVPEMLSHQNSVDTVSVGSSSVDWSPPDSNIHSRRNTILLKKELELPITVTQLRILANAPLNLAEEERRDQEKSREVLKLFRNKDAKQLSALFRRQRRRCSCSSSIEACPHDDDAGEETLAQTLERLNARHDEKTKIRLFGQNPPPATIFDIKFPSSFEF